MGGNVAKKSKTPDVIQVRNSAQIKLKDKAGRSFVQFNIKKLFTFVPEEMRITKVGGENNKIVISAILTKAELRKEAVIAKKARAKLLKKGKKK